MDVPHCVINDYNSDTYKGVLKFLNKEIPSTFLTYEDKTAALRMYKFLVKHANDDDLLRCHKINGSECRVKVLPNLDGPRSKMNDDIKELKNLMDVIINYPFGSDKPDYDRFNLSPELRCFLCYLKDYMNPKCLLDSPFIWGDTDKCRFLINLVYLLKR
ncbi:hypothetical protein Golob_005235, partial [Gossypium lobatum]|nr:hypothetical protein [Gossypium lobatum]